MNADPTSPEVPRVFWHNVDPERGDRFYTDRSDGTVAVWEQCAEAIERYPATVKMVRILRPGEPTVEQLKATHRQEIELARSMAGAHERAIAGPRLRDAELRADLAEQQANASVEAKARKLLNAQRDLDGERRAWADALSRFIAMADRVGAIWGEGDVGTEESSAWTDPEDGTHTRHFTPVALDRVLERLEGILAGEHPSVTYPAPSDGAIQRAEGVLRRQVGDGHDIRDAVRAMLADAADGNRPA